jgi:hypothetical protein
MAHNTRYTPFALTLVEKYKNNKEFTKEKLTK